MFGQNLRMGGGSTSTLTAHLSGGGGTRLDTLPDQALRDEQESSSCHDDYRNPDPHAQIIGIRIQRLKL